MNELKHVLERIADALEKGVTVTVKLEGASQLVSLTPAPPSTASAAPEAVQAEAGKRDETSGDEACNDRTAASAAPVVAEPSAPAPVVTTLRPLTKVSANGEDPLGEQKLAIKRRLSVLKTMSVEVPEDLLREPKDVAEAGEIMAALRQLSLVAAKEAS